MFLYVALNLLSLRDVTLEQRTFNVSIFGLLYLNGKMIFLAEGSMIVFVKGFVFHVFI